MLRGLQDPRAFGLQWTNKHITRCLIDCREDYKYNEEAIECLIKASLVNLPQYDYALTQSMENGLNYMAVAFAMQLIQVRKLAVSSLPALLMLVFGTGCKNSCTAIIECIYLMMYTFA